jgi:hypothetical protein
MPVLLLAYGDPQAKEMLRQAIEARYGTRPPVIDSLQINFKGRARAKVGPVTTWVPVEATAYFRFPTALRWDFTAKPLGVPVRRGVEAFDGEVYRKIAGNQQPAVIDDQDQIESLQRRLWAIAALLLTPLSNSFVKLSLGDDNCLRAENTRLEDTADLYLRPNHTIEKVQIECPDPDGKTNIFALQPSTEQTTLSDLILPSKMGAYWGTQVSFEAEPVSAQVNPDIPDATFALTEAHKG